MAEPEGLRDVERHIEVWENEVTLRDHRDDGWASKAERAAVIQGLEATRNYHRVMKADAESGLYSDAGLRARARTHREAAVEVAERFARHAATRAQEIADSDEAAIRADLAPPKDVVDALGLFVLRQELMALERVKDGDTKQHILLAGATEASRQARRAAVWPAPRAWGLGPETADKMRAAALEMRGPNGTVSREHTTYQALARTLRRVVGVDPEAR
jgi:hypothetical protein